MKSKLSMIFVIAGVVFLAAASAFLVRKLFHMPIEPVKPLKIEQPASTAAPQTLADKTIEVSPETLEKSADNTSKPANVTQSATESTSEKKKPEIPASDVVGKVVHLSGSASVKSLSGNVRLLKMNDNICRMDRIETGPKVKLEIKFLDGTMVSPGERSTIIIDECLYTPSSPASCSFAMRFTKGVCRVVTGFVAQLNPDRFKVKARMATVGIRGCDLVFKSSGQKDSVYILDVGQAKSIEIDTTSNGSSVNDLNTGKDLVIDPSVKQHLSISESQIEITITEGKGPEQRNIETDLSRDLISETSHLTPARYELQQNAGGAILKIAPPKPNETAPSRPQ